MVAYGRRNTVLNYQKKKNQIRDDKNEIDNVF